MKIEVGKELELIGHRLSDIVFLAEKTIPVGPRWLPWRWKHYSQSVLRIIADQAREAQTALGNDGHE